MYLEFYKYCKCEKSLHSKLMRHCICISIISLYDLALTSVATDSVTYVVCQFCFHLIFYNRPRNYNEEGKNIKIKHLYSH